MVNKKANKFSIFKWPEHDCYMDSSNPDTVINTTTLKAAYDGSANKFRIPMRAQIVMGELDAEKIPHFDKIVGLRLYLFSKTGDITGTPDIYVRELNGEYSKFFDEAGACWNSYKAAEHGAGAEWADPGGDYAADTGSQLDGYIPVQNAWSHFELDNWISNKNLGDGKWITLLIKENEGSTGDIAIFVSTEDGVNKGTLPVNSWRGFEFDGDVASPPTSPTGNIYIKNIHTTSVMLPIFEIVYADDVPEQPTDFKLTPTEDLPENVDLEYSESPDEDVQGYMLLATTDPKLRDFDGLKWLKYTGQTVNFTVGEILTGGISGATALIIQDNDAGVTGTLILADVNGVFENAENITDAQTGSANASGTLHDISAWGWVDELSAGANTITCISQARDWPQDIWNNYNLVVTNGRNRGKVFTITDVGDYDGVLTIGGGITASELDINDMFIIIKDYTAITADRAAFSNNEPFTYAVETNRGLFWQEAPSDEYLIFINDMTQLTSNQKYHFFVQAIDNLGMGERGGKSNIIEFVIPKINATKDFNIASVNDDDTGTSLDIYEEVYPAIYTVGLDNAETTTPGTSTTGLKDKVKYEIETGEYRYLLDTYVTTLTSAWAAGTTISLDLDAVPKTFFRVGQKVCIIDRDGTPTVVFDIRTITGIGDNSITVDAAPGHTFRINTSQIYPVKTFMYTKTGTKTGIIKARTINEEGFASPWQTPNTDPAPIDIPGIGSLKAGPTEAEKDSTKVNFNMNPSRPKDSVATISKYALDMDDGLGDTDYDEPVQTLAAYTSTGVKQPFSYIYDSNNIISPAFGQLWDYVAIGAVWNPRTIVGRTHDAGSPMDAMNAVNDIMYMGFERPNDGVYIQMVTSMLGMTFDKEYWDGAAWQTLAVTDGTVNMTQSGKIVWTPPADWESSSVNSSPTLFFVRFTVTAITATTDFFILVPLELGNNFAIVTVIDPTKIDLDSVFIDGFEKHQEEHPRRIYAKSGILGHMVKQGIKLIATFTLNGHSHNINDNYLSGFDASGVALFAGAANTDNRLDDLQILDNIIENGRLVTFKDDAGNTHTGYLSGWGLPTRMEGMPVANWQINFIPDPNR